MKDMKYFAIAAFAMIAISPNAQAAPTKPVMTDLDAGSVSQPLSASGTSAWIVEQFGTAELAISPASAIDSTAKDAVKVNVTAVDGTEWHARVAIPSLGLKEDTTYLVTFKAKTDTPRQVRIGAHIMEPDYHSFGSAPFNLTTDWQTYTYTFTTKDVQGRHGQVDVRVGSKIGTIWLSDLSVTEDKTATK